MTGLAGRIAIVTGGSEGIGAAIARGLAASGAAVAIVNRSHPERAAAVVSAIVSAGGTAAAFQADCSEVSSIEAVVDAISRHFGGIDILVNNAGIFRPVPIEETTEEIWDTQLDLNLKGAFFFARSVVPHMGRRGGGKIVNVSSIAGEAGFPNAAAYCASKGGLTNLSRALALELAGRNINVNVLAPGNVATAMNAALREDDGWRARMRERTPSGDDFLSVDDLVGSVLFLVGDGARKMHGQVLCVDGGWTAW
ncbi:gluconate 5-dehydrogenase [Enhydrobacter aerosaccus]|uniref:Gluconate 5-dehydrogenase n=1 Tax=Enhydrobacter aerosaccus TaxID=225324 RepID=A0A1T4JKZ5_9HYPH|nr:SDR family NAD(P)-dependent oxidoreductase [Enhydrobacter aerosaccus]SJZ30798.1 gluconate 5-dehydrogenase [Enhydrobacter aerosaccus]